jgi:hypothetical protein
MLCCEHGSWGVCKTRLLPRQTREEDKDIMKIPYGLSNSKDLVTEGYLYIDKTRYIATLEEEGMFNLLLRPRRFAKSLFLSSLRYYRSLKEAII